METLHHKALHNDEKHENLRRPRRPVKKIELDTREKRRLKDYFEHRATRQEVVTTTRTPLGQILDWVPIESQIRKGKIAKAPPDVKLRVDTRGARKMKNLNTPMPNVGPKGLYPSCGKIRRSLYTTNFCGIFFPSMGIGRGLCFSMAGTRLNSPKSAVHMTMRLPRRM